MWTRALLKQNAKIAFHRNYWTCVAVSVLAGLLGVAAGGVSFNLNMNLDSETESTFGFSTEMIPDYLIYVVGASVLISVVIVLAISILVTNIVEIGCARYFMENREHRTEMGQMFWGFREGRYSSNVYIMFMKNLSILLHCLLFVIPGIIKSYSYALVPYILAENPELEKDRVLDLSKEMMRGHKWELFVLEFSFLGWNILGAITLGILNTFYINPYIHATRAEFYSAVKTEAVTCGKVMPGELPGVYYQESFFEV